MCSLSLLHFFWLFFLFVLLYGSVHGSPISLGSVTESFTVFLWWCHSSLFLCVPCSLALVSVHLKKLSSLLDLLHWLLKRNTFSCRSGLTGACCDLGSGAVGCHVQWCVGAPGLGRLNYCWGRTPMFTTSKIVSSFWWVCESLKRLQRVCEPSAASRPSVYGLGLVGMLVVRVWYACADQMCRPAGLVWQILTGIMCSVWGQCQQGPESLAAAGPWLSACRLVLQGLPMVANSSGVQWQEWG